MNKILISLSVPVYGTESTLPVLLDSILEQQPLPESSVQEGASFLTKEASLRSLRFPPIEILIADDGSPGGKALPQILKSYTKALKKLGVHLELFKHGANLGTLEARRTLAENARGEYIFFVDPDDTLPPDTLPLLIRALSESSDGEHSGTMGNCGADIIHGSMDVFVNNPNPDDPIFKEKYEALVHKVRKVHTGRLEGNAVLKNLLIEEGHNSLICGKLIKTSLVRKAYEKIPHTFCTMAEDFLLYFFIALQNPSYYGIDTIIYNYYNDAGITSKAEISNLERWEKACSAASVFTVIFLYLEEHPLDSPRAAEYRKAIAERCTSHLVSNIRHLERVTPSLREEAYAMLCGYWGEDYVKQVEKALHK
ncbi:glycosyltransferase family 2 protein [Treponema sp. HNW]|uniref:glycosyltransferase family 2 protein n=1 Tax=Treponema sp. HNW TaxID=3116654 RepID=UPI003D128387